MSNTFEGMTPTCTELKDCSTGLSSSGGYYAYPYTTVPYTTSTVYTSPVYIDRTQKAFAIAKWLIESKLVKTPDVPAFITLIDGLLTHL